MSLAGKWHKHWLAKKADLEKVWKKENPKADLKTILGKNDKTVVALKKVDDVITATYMAGRTDPGRFVKPYTKVVTVEQKTRDIWLKDLKKKIEADPAKAKLKKPFGDLQAASKKIDTEIQASLHEMEEAADNWSDVDPKDAKNLDKVKKFAPKALRQVKGWVAAAAKEASVQFYNLDATDKAQAMIVLGEAAMKHLPDGKKKKAILFLVKELKTFQKNAELGEDAKPADMKKLLSQLLKTSEKLVKEVKDAKLETT